jgi:hypothetical protein
VIPPLKAEFEVLKASPEEIIADVVEIARELEIINYFIFYYIIVVTGVTLQHLQKCLKQ